MPEVKEGLFVYGSLAPRGTNAHCLNGLRGNWTPFSLPGELYRIQNGVDAGYLGFVHKPGSECSVSGWLFQSRLLTGAWKRLDIFEGEQYQRRSVSCVWKHSDWRVWFYELNPVLRGQTVLRLRRRVCQMR